MKGNRYPGLDPQVVKQVKYYRWLLKQRPLFADELEEDLEQLLLCALIPLLQKHDAHRSGLHTYAGRVLLRHCKYLNRYYARHKRNHLGTLSLDQEAAEDEDGNGCSLMGCAPEFDEDLLLRIDMDQTIAKLPEDERDLCAQLDSMTITELASKYHKSRQHIYRQLKSLRPQFAPVCREVSLCR